MLLAFSRMISIIRSFFARGWGLLFMAGNHHQELRIAMAQLNVTVGAIEDNAARIVDVIEQARDELGADVVIFPELVVTGYPPEDILLREELYQRLEVVLERIVQATIGIDALVSHPILSEDNLIYNAVTHMSQGKAVKSYCKRILPNYGVFDEARYFTPMVNQPIFEINGVRCGVMICEDGWGSEVAQEALQEGAGILMQINASPYRAGKYQERLEIARMRVSETGLPLVSVYLVGGQDSLLFDGHSFVMNQEGMLTHEMPAFEEQLALVVFENTSAGWMPSAPEKLGPMLREAEMYNALVLGLSDYVNKNGFDGVLVGLSGGIDSALVLALAVDALGSERVTAVLMPSRYTAEISNEDAMMMVAGLGVQHHIISIEPLFKTCLESLSTAFEGTPEDVTEENLQARCRGILLMGLSNKFGDLVLTTSNKSESAVGYSTLYGDMVGGFAPIKDLYKTDVYALANYRNSVSEIIPERIIMRAPSAELRANQKDQDSLPDYEVLDAILKLYIEDDMDALSIAAKGFDMECVNKVINLVKRSEYKRRQAPIGLKMTSRSFDKDWRYPITSGF